MLKVVTVEQMRRIEAAADAAGHSYAQMMQNAGAAVAHRALKISSELDHPHILALIGKGNNGGDGLVAARNIAAQSRAMVYCYLLQKRDDDPLLDAARTAGAQVISADSDPDYHKLHEILDQSDLILDALFGIGIQLPLREKAAALLQQVQARVESRRAKQSSANALIYPAQPEFNPGETHCPCVLAIDCPSGLDCDTGAIDQAALPADETITFIAAKPGLLAFPGAASVGQLTVATIGIPADLPELDSQRTVLASAGSIRAKLPVRTLDSNKGTFGKALILGGSQNYRGAVILSGRAAYRVGAGLVTISAPQSLVNSLSAALPEATWLLQMDDSPIDPSQLSLGQYDALLVGPGWGRSDRTRRSLHAVLDGDQALPPLVIDADGLNLLSEIDTWWQALPSGTIITPHPGEMSRLSSLSIADIQAHRLEIAAQKAAEWQIILILKGAHTVIANPSGDATILPFKTNALAKAGTGDVLAGTVLGFLAQGLDSYDAAMVAAYVHGLAGELAAHAQGTNRSLLAHEVAETLPGALNYIENQLVIEA